MEIIKIMITVLIGFALILSFIEGKRERENRKSDE